ncbi:hypothetical protein VP1G_00018 [Cytospora mali]|uniref:Uncharacterized protein n=1 Tax=Cytospora mali TaxID=578113 RepID=A0A194UM08_CYTMA|nr:hypothetical protein VP1G_00018 [Valsa mali var. pyri (nom. inval.)]
MASPGDAEMAGNGEPTDLDAAEPSIIKVDLNIDKTLNEPSPINPLFDLFREGSGCDLTDNRVPHDETPSIFDKFPEIFADGLDGDADNTYSPSAMPGGTISVCGQRSRAPATDPYRLPHYFMIENPGQVPEALSRVDPKVEAWASKACCPAPRLFRHSYREFNIDGELALEQAFKRIANPMHYLIVVRGFRLLMTFRNMTIKNKAPLDARTIGLFIGRLFRGEPTTLEIFNKYFLPKNLKIVPALAHGVIRKHYNRLRTRLLKEKSLQTPEMGQLLRVLRHFAKECIQGGRRKREPVGRLMMVKSYTGLKGGTVEVPPGGMEVPAGPELPRCVDLSPDFLRRCGNKWPFDRVDPIHVDVCGLMSEMPKEANESTIVLAKEATTFAALKYAWLLVPELYTIMV